MFYKPPSDAIDQGDIVSSDVFEQIYGGSCAVVLTPRCDIEWKADFLTLCAVASPHEILRKRATLDTTKKRRNFVDSMLKGTNQRFHWLEPIDRFPRGAVADFQLVASIAADVLIPEDVIIRIAGPYCEELSARYAAYMGRVGVPDLFNHAEMITRRNEIVQSFEAIPPGSVSGGQLGH